MKQAVLLAVLCALLITDGALTVVVHASHLIVLSMVFKVSTGMGIISLAL